MPLIYKIAAVAVGLIMFFGGVSLTFSGYLIAGLVLIGLVALGGYLYIRGENQINGTLAEVNGRHGTSFTRESGFGMGHCIFFDPDAQRILLTDGKSSRIEDFSFVRSWQLTWVEKNDLRTGSLSYTNVRIEIHTNDYQSPLFKFACFSKAQGEFWNARLGVLFA